MAGGTNIGGPRIGSGVIPGVAVESHAEASVWPDFE